MIVLSDADLVRYLSTADVCLSPDPANGFNELHTMNKTMEYMAMGKPVVAFDLAQEKRLSDASRSVTKRCGSTVWSMMPTDQPSASSQIVRVGLPSTFMPHS